MSDTAATEPTPEVETVPDEEIIDIEEEESFDKDRALKTIRAQRESERKLKAERDDARKAADDLKAEVTTLRAKHTEDEKTLISKLADRDKTIKSLETQLVERDIQDDFRDKAIAAGVTDINLAFLAAKEQGLLGSLDPETGQISEHNLDKLAELYPSLVDRSDLTGDAGVRGGGKVHAANQQFNRAVRTAMTRR